MKKILFLVALLCSVSIGVNAQKWEDLTMGHKNAAGTVVSADTTTAGGADTTYLTARLTSAINGLVKATFTKSSGTVGGNAILQGSYNGSTWFTLASDQTGVITGQLVEDTATLSNATATYVWQLPASDFQYYQVRFITTDGAASATGTVYYIKPD